MKKALEGLGGLKIDLICPSHGIIWRSMIPKILEQYTRWANYKSENTALIIYDSMWGSTEKMAFKLQEGLLEAGIPVTMRNLKTNHISDVMTSLHDSKLILIGSPTLNNGMLPTMGAFLTYLKGLRPKNRIGFSFGSFGWGGQAVRQIEDVMKDLKWELPEDCVKIKYIPDDSELEDLKKVGKKLAKQLK